MFKEISRKCEMSKNSGMTYGTFSIAAVVVEMVIEEDGAEKYLTCCWVSEASDAVSFEVTEKELFPYYIDLDADQDEMKKVRDTMIETYTSFDGEYDGAYVEIYKILTDMTKKKLL